MMVSIQDPNACGFNSGLERLASVRDCERLWFQFQIGGFVAAIPNRDIRGLSSWFLLKAVVRLWPQCRIWSVCALIAGLGCL